MGECILGWTRQGRGWDTKGSIYWKSPEGIEQFDWVPGFPFASDPTAMWQVVELFRKGWNGHVAAVIKMLVLDYNCKTGGDCYARIWGPDLIGGEACADNMPTAVCRAALKAFVAQPLRREDAKVS